MALIHLFDRRSLQETARARLRTLPGVIRRALSFSARRALSGDDHLLLAALNDVGLAATSLDSFGVEASSVLLRQADAMRARMPDGADPDLGRHYAMDVHSRRLPWLDVARLAPEVFLWGLQPRILDLADAYIGAPAAFIGVDVRRDVAGTGVGSRRWHRDGEDLREFKIMVHLTDVDAGSVAFEYLPRRFSDLVLGDSVYRDDEFEQLAPRSEWRRCEGPRGTVVFFGSRAVYHRGSSPPGARARDALFYTFTSRQPIRRRDCIAHCNWQVIEALSPALTPRQLAAFRWYAPSEV